MEEKVKEYKHYVITRFNISIYFKKESREKGFIPSTTNLEDEYLEKRFALFERYTFESLKRQTCKNFKWLILFHEKTPEKFKDRVKRMQQELPNLCPLYLSEEQCRIVNQYVSNYLIEDCSAQWCVTSRIDNDDAYGETYIESIQQALSNNTISKCVLSCPRGLQYDLRKDILQKYNRVTNHFYTLVTETTGEPNHCLCFDHTKLRTYNFDIRPIDDGEEKWIEIVHECNQKNDTRYGFSHIIWFSTYKEIVQQYPYIPIGTKKKYAVYLSALIIPTLIQAPREILTFIYRKLKHKVW